MGVNSYGREFSGSMGVRTHVEFTESLARYLVCIEMARYRNVSDAEYRYRSMFTTIRCNTYGAEILSI